MKYYISDLHLFHENAIAFDHRPFASLQEMHDMILKNWNDRVTNGDMVYILGDVSMLRQKEELIAFVAQLKGRKVLTREIMMTFLITVISSCFMKSAIIKKCMTRLVRSIIVWF